MAESGPLQFAWPDGGCLMAQPAITVYAFREIRALVVKEMQDKNGNVAN